MAVGTGISLYAKHQAGNYEAKVAENNAALARQQQGLAMQQGVSDASAIKAAGRQVGASAETAIAANGVEGTSGSMGNIFEINAATAAMDAERARANAARAAWGFGNEAQDATARAKMTRKATLLGGIGEGVGAAGSIASTGYQMWKAG